MRTRGIVVVSFAVASLAGCGKKSKPPAPTPTPTPVVAKKPPPPPPPVCIPPTEPAIVSMASGDAGAVQFCVGDGAEQKACFGVDLESKKYAVVDGSPVQQPLTLETSDVMYISSPTEVKICHGGDPTTCKPLKPKVPKGAAEPIGTAVNLAGTTAVLMLGDAEAGKGVAEVWDVAKAKKTATIKYAKGDHKCGEPQLLGDVVYISASVCAGPAAKGALYSLKGKKLADVGGKDFGTYGAHAVQVTPTQWAFLEEGGGAVALQDVKTGKVDKTIDLVALWGGGGERAGGNPGESALLRGGDGKLLVISGSPAAGNVGVIDVASGELTVITALQCAGTDPAPAAGADAAAPTDG